MIVERLRSIIPAKWIGYYHKTLARYGARKYHYPSERLIVIGVTGTKGKSTTCNAIWHLLTQAGYKVGMATTANFRIGERHWLNDTKMTMLGRTQLQKLMSDMVTAGCQYAIIETSSEGIKQFRHSAIHYDVVVFTNLYPEHLDAHGGFENYKQAKLELFRHVNRLPQKKINDKAIVKAVVVNGDSEYAQEFLTAGQIGSQIVWSIKTDNGNVHLSNVQDGAHGVQFQAGGYDFTSGIHGEWNAENIASALGVALTQGMSYPQIAHALQSFSGVPGRMELVQTTPFYVVVDYAYEPTALTLLYKFWRKKIGPNQKLITLISSTGGGRDVWRRAENGKVAAELCDYVIATNEDPYDEDPAVIMNAVANGAAQAGKKDEENLWRILDRRQAIQQAIALAKPGDVVLLTAKGAEQKMCVAHGKKIDWDDRKVAREVLQDLTRPTSI